MDWFSEIKVVVFDMDGTLYHEDSFVGRYVKYMLENYFEADELEEIVAETYAILNGEHPAALGKVYDRKTGYLYDHKSLSLLSAHDWTGKEVQASKPQNKDLMFIGDAWQAAKVVGLYYGASEEDRNHAFAKVRAEMLTPDYAIPLPANLSEAIRNLQAEKKIVITNSPFESGESFLEFMGLLPLFDEAKYSGNKPLGMYELFHELEEAGYQPHEILSVGDNGFNDLYPALLKGGRTIYISHYPAVNQPTWDIKVDGLDELADVFRRISKHKRGVIQS